MPQSIYRHTFANFSAATIQLSLIRDIFDIVMKASQILDIDGDYSNQMKEALARLYPYEIDSQGLLKEYEEDFPLPFPGHRHMSHLYGLFPAYDQSFDLEETLKIDLKAGDRVLIKN
jgi:alpha-L-fucosidase 2